MKKRKIAAFLAAVCITALAIAGCGSSGSSKNDYATAEYATEAAYDSSYEAKSVYQAEGPSVEAEVPMEEEQAGQVADTSRKLITTMNISAETEELDSVLSNVQNKVKELGGYIESSDIYNGSSYYTGNRPQRNA